MDSLILETSAICVTTAAGVGAFGLLSAIARQGGRPASCRLASGVWVAAALDGFARSGSRDDPPPDEGIEKADG